MGLAPGNIQRQPFRLFGERPEKVIADGFRAFKKQADDEQDYFDRLMATEAQKNANAMIRLNRINQLGGLQNDVLKIYGDDSKTIEEQHQLAEGALEKKVQLFPTFDQQQEFRADAVPVMADIHRKSLEKHITTTRLRANQGLFGEALAAEQAYGEAIADGKGDDADHYFRQYSENQLQQVSLGIIDDGEYAKRIAALEHEGARAWWRREVDKVFAIGGGLNEARAAIDLLDLPADDADKLYSYARQKQNDKNAAVLAQDTKAYNADAPVIGSIYQSLMANNVPPEEFIAQVQGSDLDADTKAMLIDREDGSADDNIARNMINAGSLTVANSRGLDLSYSVAVEVQRYITAKNMASNPQYVQYFSAVQGSVADSYGEHRAEDGRRRAEDAKDYMTSALQRYIINGEAVNDVVMNKIVADTFKLYGNSRPSAAGVEELGNYEKSKDEAFRDGYRDYQILGNQINLLRKLRLWDPQNNPDHQNTLGQYNNLGKALGVINGE